VLSATKINQVEFAITIGETLAIFFISGKISPLDENMGFVIFHHHISKKKKKSLYFCIIF
jgi:hypothetical protein